MRLLVLPAPAPLLLPEVDDLDEEPEARWFEDEEAAVPTTGLERFGPAYCPRWREPSGEAYAARQEAIVQMMEEP